MQEVEEHITIVRTQSLQVLDDVQEGWRRSGIDALSVSLSDTRSLSKEVCAVSRNALLYSLYIPNGHMEVAEQN